MAHRNYYILNFKKNFLFYVVTRIGLTLTRINRSKIPLQYLIISLQKQFATNYKKNERGGVISSKYF